MPSNVQALKVRILEALRSLDADPADAAVAFAELTGELAASLQRQGVQVAIDDRLQVFTDHARFAYHRRLTGVLVSATPGPLM